MDGNYPSFCCSWRPLVLGVKLCRLAPWFLGESRTVDTGKEALVDTLPETNALHPRMDGWNTSFLFG